MINKLPSKLQTLRIQRKLLQKEVAKCLGISPSLISAYEAGTKTPSTKHLLKLANFYNCSTDYLLGRRLELENVNIDTTGLNQKLIELITKLIEAIKELQ